MPNICRRLDLYDRHICFDALYIAKLPILCSRSVNRYLNRNKVTLQSELYGGVSMV